MRHHEVIERYYRCFRERDRAGLREILVPDFHHVSSFGEHSDRDQMLDAIWPAVGHSWARNLHIFGQASEFVVRYEVESPGRPATRMAEYVRFEGDRIAEVEVYIGRELPAFSAGPPAVLSRQVSAPDLRRGSESGRIPDRARQPGDLPGFALGHVGLCRDVRTP